MKSCSICGLSHKEEKVEYKGNMINVWEHENPIQVCANCKKTVCTEHTGNNYFVRDNEGDFVGVISLCCECTNKELDKLDCKVSRMIMQFRMREGLENRITKTIDEMIFGYNQLKKEGRV